MLSFLKINFRSVKGILFLFNALNTFNSVAQNQYTVNGSITDKKTGEPLSYATIYVKGSTNATSSNEKGFYSLRIPANVVVVMVYSTIGYENFEESIEIKADLTRNIQMVPKSFETREVVISSNSEANLKQDLKSTEMSTINLSMKQIKTIPSLMGEVDILKVIQLLPGVTKGSEGGTGFFVRGGDADQNLVLMDEATVYNVGHLFGFFSVFNPDAIRDLSMIKGAFPAQYGGRLSSVLDIRMKDGNSNKFHGEGGIGLLSSRLTLTGPIVKNRVYFMISGRRTYIDKVLAVTGMKVPYYFYDLNARINCKISVKDRLYFSSYYGNDVLKAKNVDDNDSVPGQTGFGFNLGNFTQTLRWNHIYNPKSVANFSLIHTSFKYDINGNVGDNSVLIRSEIRDIGLKADFTRTPSARLQWRYGYHSIFHIFRPNVVSTKGEISNYLADQRGAMLNTLENATWVNREWQPDSFLRISCGLRLSNVIVKNKTYFGFEPRMAASYSMSEFSSLKLGYSRMYQYMHKVSSSSMALPTDLWYPVSARVKPQDCDQVSLAYNRLLKNKITFTAETYYKWMRNLVEYEPGSNLILNDNFEDILVQGSGRSYGMEFLLRRNEGRLNGWIGYTLAFSKRDFNFESGREDYWAKYDRRNSISVVGNYEISKRFVFSFVWEYLSGARFTPAIGQFLYPNGASTQIEFVPIYTKRNSVRMSSNHRLDVNLVIKSNPKKKYQSEFHIGAYNVYNRAMPFRIDISLDPKTGGYRYTQPGLFGFIPSIAYNFSF